MNSIYAITSISDSILKNITQRQNKDLGDGTEYQKRWDNTIKKGWKWLKIKELTWWASYNVPKFLITSAD